MSCSTARLAYNNLDRLVAWQGGSYLGLDRTQRAQLREDFRPLWDWHRATQLPLYAVDLQELAGILEAGDFDREALDRTVLRANIHAQTAYAVAIGPAVGMIIFNWANDDFWLFREARVRQALVRGLDRGSVIDRHLYHLAVRADSPMLPLSWAYEYDGQTIAWPGYDLALARSLIETVNVPEDLSGERRLRVPPPAPGMP